MTLLNNKRLFNENIIFFHVFSLLFGQGSVLGSLSDVDDLATTFSKVSYLGFCALRLVTVVLIIMLFQGWIIFIVIAVTKLLFYSFRNNFVPHSENDVRSILKLIMVLKKLGQYVYHSMWSL